MTIGRDTCSALGDLAPQHDSRPAGISADFNDRATGNRWRTGLVLEGGHRTTGETIRTSDDRVTEAELDGASTMPAPR